MLARPTAYFGGDDTYRADRGEVAAGYTYQADGHGDETLRGNDRETEPKYT